MQDLDSRIDSLRHQLEHIPEVAALRELSERRTQVHNAVRDLRVEIDDLTAEQRKADRDVEQVKARQTRDQGMIDAGSVADPKALERMLGEVESLHRRVSALEDIEIEVMERLETAENALAERTTELTTIEAQGLELQAFVQRKSTQLRGALDEVTEERKLTADGVPGELLALYERLRASKDGVGAAALRARQCGGCRLRLDASILAEIARQPTDDVVRCEECSRILVRTGESGL
ncbi:MAG: C4-type zinc ribbon domain-containing protein [Actinomycetota bacterium]|nr:C4-type zinc ribbon domain-containing protein [Actinomycetota bacterium]